MSPTVKTNDTPDHNFWLRACSNYNSESRIDKLSWRSPDTSSMIVQTQLEAGFVAKHYASSVNMIQTLSIQAQL
ncbi:hypothetical protein TNCV_220601 [Trichonephila clavipes]|nr:hypothetical protein TNCV_220601 [Trichonephila clavipes]